MQKDNKRVSHLKKAAVLCLTALAMNVSAQSIRHYETQVNDFKLLRSASLAKYTQQIDQQYNLHTPYNEDFIFVNKDRTAHLRLIHHPGDGKYQMAGFEVRKGMPDADESYYSTLSDKTFITNNGTMLGLSEQDIINIQGKPQDIIQEGDYKVFYYAETEAKSGFLQQYNEAEYVIEYWFLNGTLTRFNFGFIYP